MTQNILKDSYKEIDVPSIDTIDEVIKKLWLTKRGNTNKNWRITNNQYKNHYNIMNIWI